MRRALLGCVAFALAYAGAVEAASAQSGMQVGDVSRASGLAGSETARDGDLSAIYHNPAGLTGLERPELSASAQWGKSSVEFQRADEASRDLGRTVSGWGIAVGSPAASEGWLSRIHAGLGVHLPFSDLLTFEIPIRTDTPSSPVYGTRLQRTSLTASFAVEITDELAAGLGATVSPTLTLPNEVRYDPSRGDTVQDGVIVELDRELKIGLAPTAGVQYAPTRRLSVGLAYRGQQDIRAKGLNELRAGALRVEDRLDFYDFWAPRQVSAGLAVDLLSAWSFSWDATWSQWSRFHTGHNEDPRPGFRDTFSIRSGLEWTPSRLLAARAGWGIEPSPLRPQRAETNYIAPERTILSGGLGLDFGALRAVAPRLDLHGALHLSEDQRASK
ncbi:MAG: OmpP1/FadL family transporter, partial [Bradymonadaceae bacterium]